MDESRSFRTDTKKIKKLFIGQDLEKKFGRKARNQDMCRMFMK